MILRVCWLRNTSAERPDNKSLNRRGGLEFWNRKSLATRLDKMFGYCETWKMNEMIPNHILRATHFTLYWAMVFCRNYTAGTNVNPRIVYEIMDAIHEIPNIID